MKKNNKPIEVRLVEPEKPKYTPNPSKKISEISILLLFGVIVISLPTTVLVLNKLPEVEHIDMIFSNALTILFVYSVISAYGIYSSDHYTFRQKITLSFKRILKERKLAITFIILILLIACYVSIKVKLIQYVILVPILWIEWYFLTWIVGGILTAIDYFIHVDLKEENALISNILAVLPIIISIIALFYSVK